MAVVIGQRLAQIAKVKNADRFRLEGEWLASVKYALIRCIFVNIRSQSLFYTTILSATRAAPIRPTLGLSTT